MIVNDRESDDGWAHGLGFMNPRLPTVSKPFSSVTCLTNACVLPILHSLQEAEK